MRRRRSQRRSARRAIAARSTTRPPVRSLHRVDRENNSGGLGLRGVSRAKGPRTTVPGAGPDLRPDLVDRDVTAPAQDRLWVADITYIRTFAGWVYAAYVLDVFSRRVVGWQLSTSLRTDLALDALEMGLWTRRGDGHDTSALVRHSDRGVQYVALRYTERLDQTGAAGAAASVGSRGDSYDNALAEAFTRCSGRTRPQHGALAVDQRPRHHRRRVHRLVRPPPPARRDPARSDPSGTRPCSGLPADPNNPYRWSSQPPPNPVLDKDGATETGRKKPYLVRVCDSEPVFRRSRSCRGHKSRTKRWAR